MSFGNKINSRGVLVILLGALIVFSSLANVHEAKAASNCTGPTYNAGTRTLSLVCTESTDIHELSCSDASNPDFLYLSVNGLADTVTCPPDVPPNTAPVIVVTGPTSVGAGTTHTFTITGTDAENDAVTYQVDWDNNSTPDYVSGSLPSGTGQNVTQSWATSGSYTFGARGIDANGASSAWTTHTVTVTNDTCLPNGSSYQWNGSAWAATAVPTGWNWDPTDVGILWNQAPPAFGALQIDDVGMDVTREWMNNYGLLRCGLPLPAAVTTIEAQVNGTGSWSSGDVTINPGDNVVIRWSSTDAATCTGTNVNTGGVVNNNIGVGITEPAPGSSLTYSITCSGLGGNDTEDIIITTNGLPNLTAQIVNYTPSGSVDPVTGEYDSVEVRFQMGNNGQSPTNATITYRVEIDYGNNGSYDVSQTGTTGSIASGGSTNGSVIFSNVPFGNNNIRVTVDTTNVVNEVSDADNSGTLAMNLLPVVNLELSTDKNIVREGQTAVISWNTQAVFPLDCTVSGPSISPSYTFDPSTDGPTGSLTVGPSSKSEYLLSCFESVSGLTFTETVSVDIIPTSEEI